MANNFNVFDLYFKNTKTGKNISFSQAKISK